jgi:hypothetical protein
LTSSLEATQSNNTLLQPVDESKQAQALPQDSPPSKEAILKSKKSGSKKIHFRYKDPIMETGTPRPVLSYNELIIEAINSSDAGMMSLQEIYDYIQGEYEYFKRTTVVSHYNINI